MSVNDYRSLAALIEARKTTEGISWRQAQTRARDFGYALSHESLRQWAALTELPTAEQLQVLSLVFDVPKIDLIYASLVGMGYDLDLPTSADVGDAINADGRLTTYDKALLTDLIASMLQNHQSTTDVVNESLTKPQRPKYRRGSGE